MISFHLPADLFFGLYVYQPRVFGIDGQRQGQGRKTIERRVEGASCPQSCELHTFSCRHRRDVSPRLLTYPHHTHQALAQERKLAASGVAASEIATKIVRKCLECFFHLRSAQHVTCMSLSSFLSTHSNVPPLAARPARNCSSNNVAQGPSTKKAEKKRKFAARAGQGEKEGGARKGGWGEGGRKEGPPSGDLDKLKMSTLPSTFTREVAPQELDEWGWPKAGGGVIELLQVCVM